MPSVYTYDPKDVKLLIDVVPIRSFGPDTAVTVTRESGITETEVGVNGDASVNKMRNYTGTMTINLINQSLEDLMFDVLQHTGPDIFLVTLTVPSANKQWISEAWLETQPDAAFGTMAESREHVIRLLDARPQVTGGLIGQAGNIKSAL